MMGSERLIGRATAVSGADRPIADRPTRATDGHDRLPLPAGTRIIRRIVLDRRPRGPLRPRRTRRRPRPRFGPLRTRHPRGPRARAPGRPDRLPRRSLGARRRGRIRLRRDRFPRRQPVRPDPRDRAEERPARARRRRTGEDLLDRPTLRPRATCSIFAPSSAVAIAARGSTSTTCSTAPTTTSPTGCRSASTRIASSTPGPHATWPTGSAACSTGGRCRTAAIRPTRPMCLRSYANRLNWSRTSTR